MTDFAMDHGEVFGEVVGVFGENCYGAEETKWGLISGTAASTNDVTFTVSGVTGASDDYITYIDASDMSIHFSDPKQSMEDIIGKMSEEFLEKYR